MKQPPFLSRLARLVSASILIAVIASGCVSGAKSSQQTTSSFNPQQRAMERSIERWKALIDKRFEASYGFLSDASKASVSAGEYAAAMQRMGYSDSVFESATCDEQGSCTVQSRITLPIFVRNVGARMQTLPVVERWIVNNNELWLIRQ